MIRYVLAVGALVIVTGLGYGQARPEFEVATIKRSAPDSDPFMQAHPGGRLEISRATLRTLTAFAYRLQPFQISGGPPWSRSAYFSISAKAKDEPPSEDRVLLMIQSLLAERFSLRVHSKTKEAPVYFLVVAKSKKDASTGLQVTTEGSCVRVENSASPDPSACGSVGLGLNHLEAREITMARLAEVLTRVLDRQVIDGTGRSEKFNVSLRWAPDEHEAARASSDAIPLPPDTPAVFTALREQLGLKLEPGKAPVKLLVIDRAEEPGENRSRVCSASAVVLRMMPHCLVDDLPLALCFRRRVLVHAALMVPGLGQ